jgi:hypothetical protein
MSEVARGRNRPVVAIVLAVVGVVAALLAAPASASALKHAAAKQPALSASTPQHPEVAVSAAKRTATWRWTKKFSLGTIAHLKKNQPYGTYGLECPTIHLCLVPMAGNRVSPPYNTPAGVFDTKNPAKGRSGWKLSRWNEDYAPGDSLSDDNIACAPAGVHTDCIIAGREPVPGSYNESYGGTVFQTGTPNAANWGAADVDDSSPGFGAVSCFVNVQCAEMDDNGNIFTTAGATVTSDVSVFPADSGFSGIWSMGCAQHESGQRYFFCAAVDQNSRGTIAWTLNPGASNTKWHVHNLKHGALLFNVACFRPGECILNNNGSLMATNGATGSATWAHSFKKVALPKDVRGTIVTLSCNAKLCVAAGDAAKVGQYVAISTNPYHGHWHVHPLSKSGKKVLSDGISDVSCASVKLCVVDNGYGQVTVGTLK